jgi:carotenoid cleavage dioxygenase
VPRPGAAEEGDGWIMAYVYDRASDGSVCVVLDARDIGRAPVAEIVMPRRAGFTHEIAVVEQPISMTAHKFEIV